MSRIVSKPLTKEGRDKFDQIKWNKSDIPPNEKIIFGKAKPVKGSRLTKFEKQANEMAWDIMRCDVKKSLKDGDYNNTPLNTVFPLTGETVREILDS